MITQTKVEEKRNIFMASPASQNYTHRRTILVTNKCEINIHVLIAYK